MESSDNEEENKKPAILAKIQEIKKLIQGNSDKIKHSEYGNKKPWLSKQSTGNPSQTNTRITRSLSRNLHSTYIKSSITPILPAVPNICSCHRPNERYKFLHQSKGFITAMSKGLNAVNEDQDSTVINILVIINNQYLL